MSTKKTHARPAKTADAQPAETTPADASAPTSREAELLAEIERLKSELATAHQASIAPTLEELVTGVSLDRDSDAAKLSALCAAQAQHPSDLAARAVKVLVERLSASVLAS